jgi:CHAT domain-containing protein
LKLGATEVLNDLQVSELPKVANDSTMTASVHNTIISLRSKIALVKSGQDEKLLSQWHWELASLLERTDQFNEASQHFMMAFRLARSHGQLRILGNILNDVGTLLARQGRLHSARRTFAVALACKDKYAQGEMRWSSLIGLAHANLELGRMEDFERYGVELEQGLANIDEPIFQGITRLLLSQLYRIQGKTPQAAATIQTAVDILSRAGSKECYVDALAVSAEITQANGDLESAMRFWLQVIDEVESIRASTLKQYRWLAHRYALPAILGLLDVYYALDSKHAMDGLRLTEHVKFRSLLEHYGEDLLPTPSAIPDELKAKEAELLTDIRIAKYIAAPKNEPGYLMMFTEEVDRTERLIREFWDSLPEEWREYGELRQGKPPNLETLINKRLSRSSAHILAYYPTPEQTYVWHIDSGGEVKTWDVVPLSDKALYSFVSQFLDAISKRGEIPDNLHHVAYTLLAPCLAKIPPNEMLCIVPSGPLLQLPFAALVYEGSYLVERNPIAILPSLSVLAYWDNGPSGNRIASPLILGDSRDDLPNARKEALQIGSMLDAKPLLGRDVRRVWVRNRISTCDLLHIACHAYHNNEDPTLSGFYLTDGSVFSARDFFDVRLKARLAVLSACESGRLQIEAGNELIGLSAGLLYAGASGVISTLWKVADRETRDLSAHLYSEMFENGVDCADALRRAQCKVLSRRRSSHPYFWAAFQFWGQWNNTFESQGTT